MLLVSYFFVFFKQKTAYEMRISDWSSDVCSSDLGMGPVEPAEAYIRRRVASLRAANGGQAWDPLIHLSLDWLEANVPADMPAPVIVHGDAGPGTFLSTGNRVPALLDWALVHYGDPMADLAMHCLRILLQGFVPWQQAFAASSAPGG